MEKRGYFPLVVFLLLSAAQFSFGTPVHAARSPNEEDTALEGQITQVSREVEKINLRMARLKKELREITDGTRQTAIPSELDRLRGERGTLQELLNRLVEAGKADEEKVIDQALQRARKLERIQERASEREEIRYDRRTQ